MSIQIRDGVTPATRREVAERIGALVGALRVQGEPSEHGAQEESDRENAASGAARSLFFGLVGSMPTPDEYAVLMNL